MPDCTSPNAWPRPRQAAGTASTKAELATSWWDVPRPETAHSARLTTTPGCSAQPSRGAHDSTASGPISPGRRAGATSRASSTAPTTAPASCAAISGAHGAGTAAKSRGVGGGQPLGTTKKPHSQAYPTSARSRASLPTRRAPAAAERGEPDLIPVTGPGGAGRGLSPSQSNPADAPNVTASRAKVAEVPSTAANPPPAAKPSTWPPWMVTLLTALATTYRSSGSTSGSNAARAAPNGALSSSAATNSVQSAQNGPAIPATSAIRQVAAYHQPPPRQPVGEAGEQGAPGNPRQVAQRMHDPGEQRRARAVKRQHGQGDPGELVPDDGEHLRQG